MDRVPYFSGEYSSKRDDEFKGSCKDWLKLIRKACRYTKFPDGISVHRGFIDWVDLKLLGQAREWAQNQSVVANVLNSEVSESEEDEKALATALEELLILRFPDSVVPKEEQGMLDWSSLDNLRQGADEPLKEYYGRVDNLLARLGGKDEANQSKPYSLILQRVVDAFCSGLNNQRMEFDTRRALPRTLLEAFTLASKFEHFWKNWGDREPVAGPSIASKPPVNLERAAPSGSGISRPASDDVGAQNIKEGYPAHRTKECYDVLPPAVQEIIKRGGKGLICFKCGEPNHYANACNRPPIPRSDQAGLRMFLGLPFNSADLILSPSFSKAALHTSYGVRQVQPEQYDWLMDEDQWSTKTEFSHLQAGIPARSVTIGIRPLTKPSEQPVKVKSSLSCGAKIRSGRKRVAISDIVDEESGGRAGIRAAQPATDKLSSESTRADPSKLSYDFSPASQFHGPALQKIANPSPTRNKPGLKTIKGMLTETSFDLKKTLLDCPVPINLLQLLAISPNQRAELHRLTSSAHPRSKKSNVRLASNSILPLSAEGRSVLLSGKAGSGSFYVEVTATHSDRGKRVFTDGVVDAGSEINIITESTVAALGLQYMSLARTPYEGLYMVTASGAEQNIAGWVDVIIDVASCINIVQFFVLPKSLKPGYSMLLGVPWLVQVRAKLDMSHMSLSIVSKSGERLTIKGPAYTADHELRVKFKDLNGSYSSSLEGTASISDITESEEDDIVTSSEESEYESYSDVSSNGDESSTCTSLSPQTSPSSRSGKV